MYESIYQILKRKKIIDAQEYEFIYLSVIPFAEEKGLDEPTIEKLRKMLDRIEKTGGK